MTQTELKMFPRDSGTKLEYGCLRSGRRFISRKRRKKIREGEGCSTNRIDVDYELESYINKGSRDKE